MTPESDYMVEGEHLPGSICLRCGFEPLQSQQGEWWCPECWEGGLIPPKARHGWYDEKPNPGTRAIIDVQISQLRAKHNGEDLGRASILGQGYDGHVPVEAPLDDTATFERPAGNYLAELFKEVDEELGRNTIGCWVSKRHPELAWLDHLPDKTFYRLPDSQAFLAKIYSWVTTVEWRALLA